MAFQEPAGSAAFPACGKGVFACHPNERRAAWTRRTTDCQSSQLTDYHAEPCAFFVPAPRAIAALFDPGPGTRLLCTQLSFSVNSLWGLLPIPRQQKATGLEIVPKQVQPEETSGSLLPAREPAFADSP